MRELQARLIHAKTLRANQTDAEVKLWYHLRAGRLGGFKFKRQVRLGAYIADFACLEEKLIVELDGSQHLESERDAARDFELQSLGYRVLRFWNDDVLQRTNAVLEAILTALRAAPLPYPSPASGRGREKEKT